MATSPQTPTARGLAGAGVRRLAGFVLHSGAPTVVTPPVTTDIKVTLTANRGTPADATGTTALVQGVTQTQYMLHNSTQESPGADGRCSVSMANLTGLTSGTQPPVYYNCHIMGFSFTNPWSHPPAAVLAYLRSTGFWTCSASTYTQENPYFYKSGQMAGTNTPIPDGSSVSQTDSSSGPVTNGMDTFYDTVTLGGCAGAITLCECPSWMTAAWRGNASPSYSVYTKAPPISAFATDYTTLLAHSTNVPAELLTLAASTTPPPGKSLVGGYRGLYIIDYWNYMVKAIVRRYCLPNSGYIQHGYGSYNSTNNLCTLIQIWNELGGIDWVGGTIGANSFTDHTFNEQVTAGSTGHVGMYDYAQYAWLYSQTWNAIDDAVTGAGYTRAGLGLQIAGPYPSLQWNYNNPATGVALAVQPPVADTGTILGVYYYNVQHQDQLLLAQFLMLRTGTGNAWPSTPVTARGGTVPAWTPSPAGADTGASQFILPYGVDVLCFDDGHRPTTEPIGAAAGYEGARTTAQWQAQVLLDTARYKQLGSDLQQLAYNCGLGHNFPIGVAENYFDYNLNNATPTSGKETTTGFNHLYYASHAWQACVFASQFLNMAKNGMTYVLRWAAEGTAVEGKNPSDDPGGPPAGTYWAVQSYQGNQEALWFDGRNLGGYLIENYPGGTTPPSFGGYTSGQPFPTYTVFKAFHDYFSVTAAGAARPYYDPAAITDKNGNPLTYTVEVIDNGTEVLLVNKDVTNHSATLVRPDGTLYVLPTDLAAYGVQTVTP